MAKITISNFAKKHGVTRQAIYAAIERGELKCKTVGGVKFLESNTKYEPIAGYGREPKALTH